MAGYAGKADSESTKKLLLSTYEQGGSAFLDKLNWKHIMASGLSLAAITSAYKISDGIQEGTTIIAENNPETFADTISVITQPFRWGLLILFLIFIYPGI